MKHEYVDAIKKSSLVRKASREFNKVKSSIGSGSVGVDDISDILSMPANNNEELAKRNQAAVNRLKNTGVAYNKNNTIDTKRSSAFDQYRDTEVELVDTTNRDTIIKKFIKDLDELEKKVPEASTVIKKYETGYV